MGLCLENLSWLKLLSAAANTKATPLTRSLSENKGKMVLGAQGERGAPRLFSSSKSEIS